MRDGKYWEFIQEYGEYYFLFQNENEVQCLIEKDTYKIHFENVSISNLKEVEVDGVQYIADAPELSEVTISAEELKELVEIIEELRNE